MKRIHVDIVTYDGKSAAVKPHQAQFPMIYRAARGVGWDEDRSVLYIDKRHDESNLSLLLNIVIDAVQAEYGSTLVIDENTVFENYEKTEH